jgi:hypothetical protein
MDSKIKCSKCQLSKSQIDFPDYYQNFIWLYNSSKLKDFGINPVCKMCFDKNDGKELLENEFFQSPANYGFEQCEECDNWMNENDFFFDDDDNDVYPVCKNCFDDSYAREIGFMYCSECGERKEYNDFFKEPIAGHNIKSICIDCLREKSDLNKCTKCGNWKKRSEFYTDPSENIGLYEVCKNCFDYNDWETLDKKKRGPYFFLKAILIAVGAVTIFRFIDPFFESLFSLDPYILLLIPLILFIIFIFIDWLRH